MKYLLFLLFLLTLLFRIYGFFIQPKYTHTQTLVSFRMATDQKVRKKHNHRITKAQKQNKLNILPLKYNNLGKSQFFFFYI